MQKASANLDVDKHSVPSDGVCRTREDEYSSTDGKSWKIDSETEIWMRGMMRSHLPVPLNRLSFLSRSSSICGAVTANELNTSMRANCSSASRINGSSVLQSTWKKLRFLKSNVVFASRCLHTCGHCARHNWTPQLTCNRSRSGNLNAGKVAVKSFSTKSSTCGFDHPSSAGRSRVNSAGITCSIRRNGQNKNVNCVTIHKKSLTRIAMAAQRTANNDCGEKRNLKKNCKRIIAECCSFYWTVAVSAWHAHM